MTARKNYSEITQGEFDKALPFVEIVTNQAPPLSAWNTIRKVFHEHPLYKPTMFQRVWKRISSSARPRAEVKDDPFIWDVAEALMWRDEEVSFAAIPSPIREQPDAARYYADAEYIVKFAHDAAMARLEKKLSYP